MFYCYNLFLLPDTNKADKTKLHSEFSRYSICISKFCFHFLKEVMCFSKVLPFDNLDIKTAECTDHWLSISPILFYGTFSSCVPTVHVLVPTPHFFQSFLLKKKDCKTASQSSITSPYKTPFNVSFPLCSKLYLGALLDYYRFNKKYLMTWK